MMSPDPSSQEEPWNSDGMEWMGTVREELAS